MRNKADRPASVAILWQDRDVCMIVLDVSLQTWNRVVPFIPEDSIEEITGYKLKKKYYIPKVVKAAVAAGVIKGKADDDGDSENVNSPNLERLRKIKADDAEVEFARKCGQLVLVDDWDSRLAAGLWGTLERFGEVFKREFGREGVQQFNAMVESIKRKLLRVDDDAAV